VRGFSPHLQATSLYLFQTISHRHEDKLNSIHLLSKMTSITPAPQISCIIQIKNVVKPSEREAWLLLFKQCFDHVAAEPECAYFIMGEEETGVFRWTEGWTKDKNWIYNVRLPQATKSELTDSRCSSRNRIMRRSSWLLHQWSLKAKVRTPFPLIEWKLTNNSKS
jgi:hypothetical protein